mgnify:FL=1
MPSYATCHIFAATVQRVTSDAVAHIIDSAPSAYRWGAQGAAPLRMYHAPFPSSLHRVADELRTKPPAQLFEALCQAAVDAHNTAALAYVFGFCTNYALSRVTSLFLDEQADRLVTYMPGYSAAARRQLAASDIDGIMIENYIDTSPADYAAYRLLNAEAPDCTAAARVLAQAVRKTCDTRLSPAAVYRGMHDMRHILHLAHNGMLVRGRLQHLERLLGKTGMASSYILPAEPLAADCANREHRPWQSASGERTESFCDLFDAAVPLAVSLQRAVLDRYFQKKPLDIRFFPSDFNGNSVKTEN